MIFSRPEQRAVAAAVVVVSFLAVLFGIVAGSGAAPVYAANPACGATITVDTTLDGPMDCTGTTGAIFVLGTNGVTFDGGGFTILAPDADFGFVMSSPNGATVKNVTILQMSGIGVQLRSGSNGNTVSGVVASWDGPDYMGKGVSISGSSGNTIENVTAHKRSYGIHLQAISAGNIIRNNDLSDSFRGIDADPPLGATLDLGNKYFENDLSDSSFWAMNIRRDNLLQLSGNNFTNSTMGLTGMDGLNLSHDATGAGNTIDLSKVKQVSLKLVGVTDSTFTGIPANADYGVKLVSGSNGNTISGIDASWYGPGAASYSSTGIYIHSSTGNTIENVTADNHAYGIRLFFADSEEPSSVVCSSAMNNRVGVDIGVGSADTVVNRNHIEGNTQWGLRNNNPPALVNAKNNYWGASDGPAYNLESPTGSGDKVVRSEVDADPFFTSAGQLDTACDGLHATPPVVTPPEDISVNAEGPAGNPATNAAIAAFLNGATAEDNYDGDVAVANDAPATFGIGATIVTFSATDAAGNLGTAEATVTVLGPRDRKQAVIVLLDPFADESKRISKAIRELNKGLEEKLWLDGFPDPKHGKKVFDRERHAVKELMQLLKDASKGKSKGKGKNENDVSDLALQAAADAIDALIAIDKLMAQVAIDAAKDANVVDPSRQDKFDKEIEKAEKELGKGDSEADKDKFDKAIDHYRKAWKHAFHAAREAARVPEPDEDEDGDGRDPLDLAGLSPEDAIASLIQYINDQGPSLNIGISLIADLDAVTAALTLPDDQAAIDLLKDFRKRVNEDKRDHLLTNEQARIMRQSAQIIIRAIEAG
jgi:parallel beta-helix repeat protein